MNAIDDAMDFFEELKGEDPGYASYVGRMGPLADFLAEYEYQKGVQGITQTELAQKAETRQSAISRFESMKHPPSYDFLVKIAGALGDRLFVSPAGSYCLEIPYDLREAAKAAADRRGMAVDELAGSLLRESLNREAFKVSGRGSMVGNFDFTMLAKPADRTWANSINMPIDDRCLGCGGDSKDMAG